MFNSDRGETADVLYGSKSRRLVRRYDYTNLPSPGWLFRNLPWILLLLAAAAACAWFTRVGLKARKFSSRYANPISPTE